MQFGRFHAWMLIAFGALLLACQAWISFSPPAQSERTPVEVTQPEHKFPPIAGILGGVALVIGVGLYATNRQRDRVSSSKSTTADVK